jgi:hypothetical protein
LKELLGALNETDYDLNLTGFGTAELKSLLAVDLPDDAPPASDAVSERSVQLFLTETTLPVFMRQVRALQATFGTDDVTSTVSRAVELCYRSHNGDAPTHAQLVAHAEQ